MVKKSYNPLKMIGSLVGAIIGGTYGYFALSNFWFDIFDVLIWMGFLTTYKPIDQAFINYPMAILIHAIIGFLIGWGMHSLIRKYA